MALISISGVRADTPILDRISAVVARFNDWRSYRRTVAELSTLSDRELQDIGISRADIRAIARGEITSFAR